MIPDHTLELGWIDGQQCPRLLYKIIRGVCVLTHDFIIPQMGGWVWRKAASSIIDCGDMSRLRATLGFMAGGGVTHTRAAISWPPLSPLITALITGIKSPIETLVNLLRSPGARELKRSSSSSPCATSSSSSSSPSSSSLVDHTNLGCCVFSQARCPFIDCVP